MKFYSSSCIYFVGFIWISWDAVGMDHGGNASILFIIAVWKAKGRCPGMLRELHGRGPFHRLQCRLQKAGQEEWEKKVGSGHGVPLFQGTNSNQAKAPLQWRVEDGWILQFSVRFLFRPTLAILYSLITRWRKALLYFQIKKKLKDHLGRERVYFNMQRFACRAAAGAPHSLSLDVHIS